MKKVLYLLTAMSSALSAGTLPMMEQDPWIGWYAGVYQRQFRFGVDTYGKAEFIPINSQGKEMGNTSSVVLIPFIEEIRPNGKVIQKQADQEGWEAVSEKGDDVEEIVYRGTAAGGVSFEVKFDVSSKSVRGSGKILEKGEMTKFPIRLAMRMDFRDPYRYQKDEEKLAELLEDDEIRLSRTDRKKLKLEVGEPIDLGSDEVSGPGLTDIRVEYSAYKGSRFEIKAESNSHFIMRNKKDRPIHKGFSVIWRPDPSKDPKGQSGFELSYK